jgi:hypothetical protein
VAVRVDDGQGETDEATASLTVANTPPTVSAGADATINVGDTLAAAGSFADLGADTWTATVDYGDGTGPQPLSLNADKTFALEHVYDQSGTFTVTDIVTDDESGEGSDTLLVEVVAPSLDVDANGTADALTDGILVLRYLFGFTGDALVEDALAPDATRTDPVEVQDFVDQFKPAGSGVGSPSIESSSLATENVTLAAGGATAPASIHEEQADAVWADLSPNQREYQRLGDDLPSGASFYRALAFDAVQGASEAESEDKKEDSSTRGTRLLDVAVRPPAMSVLPRGTAIRLRRSRVPIVKGAACSTTTR